MVAVVRKIKHHRVLQQAAIAEQIGEPAHLVVEMTDDGVISVREGERRRLITRRAGR